MNKALLALCLSPIAAIACTGTLQEQGHPCPCASPYTCCASTSICVPAGGACSSPIRDSGLAEAPGPSGVDDATAGVDAMESVDAPPSGERPIVLDGGVGGLCSVADAAPPDAGPSSMDADAEPSDGAAAAASCYCTRRPGTGNSVQCPAGVGEHASATIGPSGASVSLQGRQGVASGVAAQLNFPPTALATPTRITLVETAIPPPEDLLDWSPVYLVQPAGLALAARTPVQLPWSSGPLSTPQGGPSVTTVADLSIWFSADGTCFTRVSDSYTNAGFEQGSLTQLGYLIVGAPRTASTATCP
jgi:hypothetical protein